MKKSFVFLLMMQFCFTSFAKGEIKGLENINEGLIPWSPKRIVEIEEGKLRIILNSNQVNETTYYAVLKTGICLTKVIMKKEFSGIREIQIINQFERQGFVFEGGERDCKKMLNSSSKKTLNGETISEQELFILEKTSWF